MVLEVKILQMKCFFLLLDYQIEVVYIYTAVLMKFFRALIPLIL